MDIITIQYAALKNNRSRQNAVNVFCLIEIILITLLFLQLFFLFLPSSVSFSILFFTNGLV